MKVSTNLKERINDIVQDEWYLLAKRTQTPPLPVWLKFPIMKELESQKIYNTKMYWVVVWHDPYSEFYLRGPEFKKAIRSVTKLLFSYEKAKKHIKKVEFLSNKAKECANFFYVNNLEKTSNEELLKKYNKTIRAYGISFVYGFITWCSQILQDHTLMILKKYRKELKEIDLDERKAFGILVTSDKLTAYTEKEKALDELSKKYKRKSSSALKKDIKQFLEKYQWVGYDYGGPAMTYDEVMKIIRGRELTKKGLITKKDIMKACSFKSSEKGVFEIFSELSFIKDMRNSCDDFVHFCLDFFYTEVGRRYRLSKEEVRFLWPEELEKLLKNEEKYSKDYLHKKMKYSAANTYLVGGLKSYYIGEEAKKFLKKIGIKIEEKIKKLDKIEGTPASTGIVKGRVKTIQSFGDLDKVKKGDVLVTHMTSPRYMSAITKSCAIVTDEGGLTSHAAIIARELRKPCVVGTKIATKVLKDGDLVKVDANKGIIRKIS